MAGLLKTRSIPTPLQIDMACAMKGQAFECPQCGMLYKGHFVMQETKRPPGCVCCDDLLCYPRWDVWSSRGRIIGNIAAPSLREAEKTVLDSRAYARLKSFRVSPQPWAYTTDSVPGCCLQPAGCDKNCQHARNFQSAVS